MSSNNERLRIAFVEDSFGQHGTGGIVSAKRFIDKLREHHDVIMVGADVEGPGTVRVPTLALPIRAMREMGFTMARPDRKILLEAFADVDIVHLQLPFWLSIASIGIAHELHKPVVAAFHVQPENAFLNVGIRWKWLNSLAYWFWIRAFYNRADAIVAPTRFAANKLEAHGLHKPVHVVSNGVPEFLKGRPRRERLPFDDGRPIRVLSVGRLGSEKHQADLIEAVKRSRHRKRIRLVLAGKGPQLAELAALASTLDGARVGFVPDAELLELRETSDLFVHASEVELEGMAVIEAMAVGLPALIADGPETAASEFALDDRFRFPVCDAGALARKMDALLDDPAALARAGELYRSKAVGLDFDKSVERLENVYRSALRGVQPTTMRSVVSRN